ncbi:MAG TPA: replicative DNA helicase [Arenimonas sp.]|uniref:replicative DNA helicase n=1 Tax=Arenimonas sp. TaxID=1872635 RepID=UPI002BBCC92E|nr:replicative DNA helicase [Arenimonas sp.]HMB57821.1 replicative DNA helicase [Arenimonas sp.]
MNLNENLRVPPCSIEAEQSVIGGLMLSPAALWKVRDLLTETDFYRRDHRLIYRAILELNAKGQPFDAVTLGEWIEANGLAEQIGNTGYLIDLASSTPSAANVQAYANIVREKSIRRRLIDAGTEIINLGFQADGRPAIEALSEGQARLGSILQSEPSELESTVDVLRQLADQRARRYEIGGEIDGLRTGFDDLDRLLCGLKPGQLIVIAGRPKMGKTTLAMNIAEHAAITQRKRVAVHSLEMPTVQLIERACCSVGRVPHDAVRRCEMDDGQERAFAKASSMIAGATILMSRPRNVRIQQLVAQTQRSHAEKSLDLVVIDYLQLIEMSGAERRDIAVGDITRGLKLMAVSMGVPVILLSQLNRNLEARVEKRPVAADLRDGGGIEQDADVVLFVYRDEVYDTRSPDRGTAEIIVGLQRAGPTGMVRLSSRLDICRFDELDPQWRPEFVPTTPRAGFGSSSHRNAARNGGQDRAANS